MNPRIIRPARCQRFGFGAVLVAAENFGLKGELSPARRFRERTRIFLRAVSPSGNDSLIVLPIYTYGTGWEQWSCWQQESGPARFACRLVWRILVTSSLVWSWLSPKILFLIGLREY